MVPFYRSGGAGGIGDSPESAPGNPLGTRGRRACVGFPGGEPRQTRGPGGRASLPARRPQADSKAEDETLLPCGAADPRVSGGRDVSGDVSDRQKHDLHLPRRVSVDTHAKRLLGPKESDEPFQLAIRRFLYTDTYRLSTIGVPNVPAARGPVFRPSVIAFSTATPEGARLETGKRC